jgi:hypothetical protein
MADLRNIADVSHWWGNDLQVSATGDLGRATGVDRSKQRVLRRLLTPTGDYVMHTDYGAGLPSYIGRNSDPDQIETLISGQMLKEASVTPSPRPDVALRSITNGLSASISYVVAPEKVPAVLSFDLSQ